MTIDGSKGDNNPDHCVITIGFPRYYEGLLLCSIMLPKFLMLTSSLMLEFILLTIFLFDIMYKLSVA